MLTARVEPMPQAELDEWRAAMVAAERPLPESSEEFDAEAVHVVVNDVVIGGAALTYDVQAGRSRAMIRVLQTTLTPDDVDTWAVVLGALETHARVRRVRTLMTAVPAVLVPVFQEAGFKSTMTTVSKRLDAGVAPELQEDRRVSIRPMDLPERERFAGEAMGFLRAGMERAGVVAGQGASLAELEARVARLTAEPPPGEELLMMGLVDGVPVGRAWATLHTDDEGQLDFYGNTIDLFPEFRGQGLTRSFLGALRRHVRDIGVRDVHLRVYAHDTRPRHTFIDNGAGIDDVHLRLDLDG